MRHNELRYSFAKLLIDVCHDVKIETQFTLFLEKFMHQRQLMMKHDKISGPTEYGNRG